MIVGRFVKGVGALLIRIGEMMGGGRPLPPSGAERASKISFRLGIVDVRQPFEPVAPPMGFEMDFPGGQAQVAVPTYLEPGHVLLLNVATLDGEGRAVGLPPPKSETLAEIAREEMRVKGQAMRRASSFGRASG